MLRPRILLLSNDPPIASQVIEALDPRFFDVRYVAELDFDLFRRVFFEFRPHMIIDRVQISALSAGDEAHHELIGNFLWRFDDSREQCRHIPVLMIYTLNPQSRVIHVAMGANERVSEGVCSDKDEFHLWVRHVLRIGTRLSTNRIQNTLSRHFDCPECGSIRIRADVLVEIGKLLYRVERYDIDGWFEVPRYQVCADCGSPIPAHLGENWFHRSPDELRAEWQGKFRDAPDRPDVKNLRVQKIPRPLTVGQYEAFEQAWKAK